MTNTATTWFVYTPTYGWRGVVNFGFGCISFVTMSRSGKCSPGDFLGICTVRVPLSWATIRQMSVPSIMGKRKRNKVLIRRHILCWGRIELLLFVEWIHRQGVLLLVFETVPWRFLSSCLDCHHLPLLQERWVWANTGGNTRRNRTRGSNTLGWSLVYRVIAQQRWHVTQFATVWTAALPALCLCLWLISKQLFTACSSRIYFHAICFLLERNCPSTYQCWIDSIRETSILISTSSNEMIASFPFSLASQRQGGGKGIHTT